jgi:hypothetical protein
MGNQEITSLLGILGRVIWIMLGPLLLVLMTFLIIETGNGWLTAADFAFLSILAGMMLGRWLEFHAGNPQTAEGEPATARDLRRYLIGTTIIGLGVWAIANVIGNYWWPY